MRLIKRVALTALLTVISTAHADQYPLFPPQLVELASTDSIEVFQGKPGEWDAELRERGWIMREGNQWRLWYTGTASDEQGQIRRLGYATSSDGISWQRHPANPILPELWIEDVMVVKANNRYLMFAEGLNDRAQWLSSTDGIDWAWQGYLDIRATSGSPISEGPYGTPTAWFEHGTWFLFYERFDLGVWLATSTDLKTWTNVDDEPIIEPGPDGYDDVLLALDQILKFNNHYYAILHGRSGYQRSWLDFFGRTPEAKPRWSTYVAVSDDLRHWYKYWDNPITTAQADYSSPVLVDDGTQFRLYTTYRALEVQYLVPDNLKPQVQALSVEPDTEVTQ